jgi:hypothetical protein
MTTETLTWQRSTSALPDDELTVLALTHQDEITLAWRDESGWHDCGSGGDIAVVAWANVRGPEVVC